MKDEEKKGRIITEDTKKMNKEFKAKKAQAMIEKHDDQLYAPFGTGIDAGTYELISVVTHKGRGAKSGHYVGYCHNRGSINICFCFLYFRALV